MGESERKSVRERVLILFLLKLGIYRQRSHDIQEPRDVTEVPLDKRNEDVEEDTFVQAEVNNTTTSTPSQANVDSSAEATKRNQFGDAFASTSMSLPVYRKHELPNSPTMLLTAIK
ncbi:hypothetical protein L1987_10181 [Smallanthus sonchifolius]|uniref:Uncharacterized protein n=1 Tax=Smallanthus sonchifolius TaxID=185202 RepID=A0ACB9JRL2_9ASTR|nr:hypothetical protein L1987_10181 [Smallanthus sonchifolius]